MTYTVVWRPSAIQQLAALWNDAADRAAVTAAANLMDTRLRHDPTNQGESREGAARFWHVPPLAIYFDVIDSDCLVTVWAVWRP